MTDLELYAAEAEGVHAMPSVLSAPTSCATIPLRRPDRTRTGDLIRLAGW